MDPLFRRGEGNLLLLFFLLRSPPGSLIKTLRLKVSGVVGCSLATSSQTGPWSLSRRGGRPPGRSTRTASCFRGMMGNVVAAGQRKDTAEQKIAAKYHFYVVVVFFLLVFRLRNGRGKRLMLKCGEVHEWTHETATS